MKTAGADLAKPRSGVESSANDVLAANDELAKAQRELAAAKGDLAEAKSGTSTTTSASDGSSSTTTAPLLPSATTNRIKQAEADFETASEGITDRTPLAEAGENFNAAAFALEVSWLSVLVAADCLTDEQLAKAETAVHDYTVALQTALRTAGYYEGSIDGVYGPSTVDAVKALQTKSALPVTGLVDRATAAALSSAVVAKGGNVATQALAQTSAVQSTLKLAGYWNGPIDGQWTQQLTDSLKEFQSALGVPTTGAVDAATLDALEQTIAKAKGAATSTTDVPTTAAGSNAEPTTQTSSPTSTTAG